MSSLCSRLWRPELQRAVMKVRPEYFTWPTQRQERYKVAIPEADHALLKRALLGELFGRTCTTLEAAEIPHMHLSRKEFRQWDRTVLPLYGIGEDCFHLDDLELPEGKTLLDLHTVRDFDADWRGFYESPRQRESARDPAKPYRGSLYLREARLYVDTRFAHATMSLAAGYLYSNLETAAHGLIQARFPDQSLPYLIYAGGDQEDTQWDASLLTDGPAKELCSRVWAYLHKRWGILKMEWDESGSAGVYLVEEQTRPELIFHFVFSDKEAMQRVRFSSFLRDCRAIERPAQELAQTLDKEKAALERYIG